MIFTGDVIMTAAGPVSWEGPLDNIIKAMELILSMDIEVLVPGHGPLADKRAARESIAYWDYTAEEAHKLFVLGVPAADAARELSTEGRYNSQEHSILNMINMHMLYRGFSGDESPPDKPEIIGKIAEILIPD